MSPNDLELEDGLKDIGNKLASPPSDLQQLLLLLDKAENLLLRVEQSPSVSMFVALRPAMKALIAKDLLGHSNMDVKVAITSCLSEITRITAPDAPYDDDLMKEIFGLIVGAFKNLDDMSSRSFPKRVSILETVAKVRSCVLMLDLDCDDLILEMFHHFLKTIRLKHSDTVFSSMETVMTLVLEESESISARLLSCLLDCVKIVEKNILPTAKKLAEKVLVNCSLKLKPYLAELFNGSGALLRDYSKIVAAVFQGNLDTSMQNEMNASCDNQADDQKLSERTLSDDLPQGSAQQEGEIFHPEKAVAAADRASKSVMSNGCFQIGNGNFMAAKNEFCHHSGNIEASLADSDILDSGTAKPDSRSDPCSRNGRRKALLKSSISNDHYGVGSKKDARANSGRRKGSSKEAEISQADGPSKEVESVVCSKIEKKNEFELTSDSPDVVASISLHSPNEHDGTRPRSGRFSQSSGKRNAGKAAAGGLSSAGHKEFLFRSQATNLELPKKVLISNESEALGDLERKQLTGSTKKSRSGNSKDGKGGAEYSKSTPTTATSDYGTDLLSRHGSQRKVGVNLSEKKQSAGTKKQKGVKHPEAEDKELKLKELISSQKSKMKELVKDQLSSQKAKVKELVKDYNHVKDTGKTKSRWKRARDTQEIFEPRKRRKGLDDTIVGSKIKIWWPDDQRFYDGIVDSFDQNTKMHKILYNDGDVEVLLLKKEQWEFIEEDETKMNGEKDKPDVSASETSKKAKSSTDAAADKTTDFSLKSPDSPVSGHLPKHRGRQKIKILSDEAKSSTITRGKSRNKHSEESHKDNQTDDSANKMEDGTRKIGRRIKIGPSKIRGKVVKDTPKESHVKSNGDFSRSSKKSKNNIHLSMKKSRASYDSVRKSMDGSPKPKSAEGRHKSGRMQGKDIIQKAKGRMKPGIISNLNAKSKPSNSQSKRGKADAHTSEKKRKRARLGK